MPREAQRESRNVVSSPLKSPLIRKRQEEFKRLTKAWGPSASVSLYLERCQVETPDTLVEATWQHVNELRPNAGKVVDFGAGDGRFSNFGSYDSYVGYEIDTGICEDANLRKRAELINACAFSDQITDADVCVGNPPFVRNQDLPRGWREHASEVLRIRSGVQVSGLANAWQYFFFLALMSVKETGLCALIIPFEWVSRPSSKAVRDFIIKEGWNVSVYRLVETTFKSVLTTSSITIVDKVEREGKWSYFEESATGTYSTLKSPSGSTDGVIRYQRHREMPPAGPRAKRGLSPGTQKILTLTEGERVRFGLDARHDVVPCITTMRHLPGDVRALDHASFQRHFRANNQKCWLIRTDREPSAALAAYLATVPEIDYNTATCLQRKTWWQFTMPDVPDVLFSMSFKGRFPKAVRNHSKARAVGGVYGIYNLTADQEELVVGGFGGLDISRRVVAHSNGLHKIEIGQLNALLVDMFGLDIQSGG